MTKNINNILRKYLGVKIIRSDRLSLKNNKQQDGTSPLQIEIIGVAGVGKTTLYRNISRKKKEEWLYFREFKSSIPRSNNHELLDGCPIYQKLATLRIDDIHQHHYLPVDQLKMMRDSYNILIDDAKMVLSGSNHIIIQAEGLLHNFGNTIIQLQQDPDALKKLMKNRSLIYCYAPADIIAQRVIKRKSQTGKLNPEHKKDSFGKLVGSIEAHLEKKHKLISLLKEYAPVLCIDTSQEMAKNLDRINRFIKTIEFK